MASKLTSNTALRYIAAGVLSYAIELSTIYLLAHAFHLASISAVAIAFWIGLTASFFLQKTFAFASLNFSKKNMAKQLALYFLLVIFNYLFTLGLVFILSDIEVAFTRTAALVLTTFWNYYIYKYILFTK